MEINFLQVLFQMINFGVVFGAITFLLYKPIMKMLDDRAAKVNDAAIAAEKTLKEKEEIEALKKKSKSASDREAAKVFEKAETDAKEMKGKLSKEAKEEVDAWKEREMKKWDTEKKGMRKELEKSSVDMAIAIATKIIGKTVNKKDHATLINSSLKELEGAL